MLFFKMNLFIVLGFGLFSFFRFGTFKRDAWITPSQLLKLGHWIYFLSVSAPLFVLAVGRQSIMSPQLQIWMAPSFRSVKGATLASSPRTLGISLGAGHVLSVSNPKALEWVLLGLFLIGALWMILKLSAGVLSLMRIVKSAHTIKKLGRVRILTHEVVSVPFSFWFPGAAYILIPTEMFAEIHRARLATLHELQHHRQGDTVLVYWHQLVKLFFFMNPFVYLWEKQLSAIQEFACDEKLIVRKGVSPHAYGRCLVWTAEQALGSHAIPIGTIGMAAGTSGKTLNRRIKMMFDYKQSVSRRWIGLVSGTAVFLALTGVALASQNLVRDRRLSLADAKKWVANSAQNSVFPIVVNESVLHELNRFVGTPDGREYFRDAMARMQTYRPMIDAKIQAYGLPEELVAVPLVESGYRNIRNKISAGLWQFIQSTAHKYGMEVSSDEDDRMNVPVETDAALRYLESNYLRFQDWMLAIEAYNAGESRVQEGIDATGSRDAWKVVEAGYEGDSNYLARVMAAVIILKNPDVLN